MNDREHVVYVDDRLKEIILFFENETYRDFDKISAALTVLDWPLIERIAHTLKGECGSYGFDLLSVYALDLENAARRRSVERVQDILLKMRQYLLHVEVRFEKVA